MLNGQHYLMYFYNRLKMKIKNNFINKWNKKWRYNMNLNYYLEMNVNNIIYMMIQQNKNNTKLMVGNFLELYDIIIENHQAKKAKIENDMKNSQLMKKTIKKYQANKDQKIGRKLDQAKKI